MTNVAPLISGGGYKITDFLEDPVELPNMTVAQMEQCECFFGDFTYGNRRYLGYGILGGNPNGSPTNRILDHLHCFSIYDSSSNANYYYKLGCYHLVYDSSLYIAHTSLDISAVISGSMLETYKLHYPTSTSFKGKIWGGKFKQLVQE